MPHAETPRPATKGRRWTDSQRAAHAARRGKPRRRHAVKRSSPTLQSVERALRAHDARLSREIAKLAGEQARVRNALDKLAR